MYLKPKLNFNCYLIYYGSCSLLSLGLAFASHSRAVQGTKEQLNFARGHSVDEGLENMKLWNAAHLQSEDVRIAAMAQMDRSAPPPTFSKL